MNVSADILGMNTFFISGGHTLSGACLEPRALNELFPNWKEMDVSLLS